MLKFGATEAIKDIKYLKEITKKIINTREITAKKLKELGFKVLESKTNFLFISHKEKKAEEIFYKLRDNKILVRYFKKPRLDNTLRVTIGTDEQMDKFIETIKDIIKEWRINERNDFK